MRAKLGLWKSSSLLAVVMALASCASAPSSSTAGETTKQRPEGGFVSVEEAIPGILVEARYFSAHNFIGKPIRGYRAAKCLLTRQAAEALAKVQAEVKPQGYSLKVYDCYRPQRAVDYFVEWAKDLNDQLMKPEFYPKVDKSTLFQDGYIASRSGHSRGSTLDLTLVKLPPAKQPGFQSGQKLAACYEPASRRFKDNTIDMGTGYDCFDVKAHTASLAIGEPQRKNRLLLKEAMERHGFVNYDKEWWHFTLKNEPYPSTFFDFEVE